MAEKAKALLTMSANGFGKKTSLKEYKVQHRGVLGHQDCKSDSKDRQVDCGKSSIRRGTGINCHVQKGQVIRTALKDIPTLGRQTQGVTHYAPARRRRHSLAGVYIV